MLSFTSFCACLLISAMNASNSSSSSSSTSFCSTCTALFLLSGAFSCSSSLESCSKYLWEFSFFILILFFTLHFAPRLSVPPFLPTFHWPPRRYTKSTCFALFKSKKPLFPFPHSTSGVPCPIGHCCCLGMGGKVLRVVARFRTLLLFFK